MPPRALRELDWAPRSLRRMRRDLDQAIARLRHTLKREPNEDEVAGELSMSRAEYDKSLDQIRTLDLGAIRQLDATGEDGSPLFELCLDPDEGPDAQLHRTELRTLLAGAIRELPEREREILALYYEEELTMAETARSSACASRGSRSCARWPFRACAPACATRSGICADEPRPLPGRNRRAAHRVGPQSSSQLRVRGRPARRSSATTSAVRPRHQGPDPVAALPHDRFARNVSTSMSAYMRVVTDVTILSVEQFTYSEFLMSLSDPTAFYAVSMRPLEGTAALELNPSVAFTMIDRMLGGSGRGVAVNRALTEIEQNVTDGVVKLILENLTDAWRGIVDVQFRISGRETRPQMLQVAAPNEVVLLMSFEIRIGEVRGVLNICFPAASLEVRLGRCSFSEAVQQPGTMLLAVPAGPEWATVGRDVTLARTRLAIGGRDFRLQVGDIVGLEHPAGEPIEVRVNGKTKFVGAPVASATRSHIRIEGPVRASRTHAA
jgi:flagellar motor switch protein FliM